MFFSIIIPVYNVEKYIDKCLQSVVTQDFFSYEVIVVNDGTEDNSDVIIERYREKYSFVKVINQSNAGLAQARNSGLNVAKGEWIIFVDSDDWIEPDMLTILHKQINENKADLYCFNEYKTDEKGIITEKLLFSAENKSYTFYNEKVRFSYFMDVLMQYKSGWEATNRIFKRSIIKQNRILFNDCDKIFAEDYLFTFEYLLYAQNVEVLCNILYNYRQRDMSLIHSVDYSSIIRRLYNWAECAFFMTKKAGLKYFIKQFHKLYFMLMNHHIQYLMAKKPMSELQKDLDMLNKNKRHRVWMRKILRQKPDLVKYMRISKWI